MSIADRIARHNRHMLEAMMPSEEIPAYLETMPVVRVHRRHRVETTIGNTRLLTLKAAERAQGRFGGRIVTYKVTR